MFLFSYFTRFQERDSFLPFLPLPSLSPLLPIFFSLLTHRASDSGPQYTQQLLYTEVLPGPFWFQRDEWHLMKRMRPFWMRLVPLKKRSQRTLLPPPAIGRWSKKLSSGTINRLVVDMISSGLPVSKMVRNNFWLSTNKPSSGWYYYGNLTGLSFVLLCNSWMKARYII